MGIGMVVPTHHLAGLRNHGPAALQMQPGAREIEAKGPQVVLGFAAHLLQQPGELRMLMQLPDAMKIPCPGTTWIGVGMLLAAQGQHLLQHQG
jgi:hypothetical protein